MKCLGLIKKSSLIFQLHMQPCTLISDWGKPSGGIAWNTKNSWLPCSMTSLPSSVRTQPSA